MHIAQFDALRHYRQVAELWEQALGDRYGVTERVLMPRIWTRGSYGPGDGVVAIERRRVVGFGTVEVNPAGLGPGQPASIQALVVDPARQRRGIGSALLERLEERLRQAGATEAAVSGGPWRFWTGVPDDLPAARAFFEAHGYQRRYEAVDMFGPLEDACLCEEDSARVAEADAAVGSMDRAEVGAVYGLLTREVPSWRGSLLQMVMAGDTDDVLVVRRAGEIIGQVQTYAPQSRFRGANLVWERILGADIGGFGAVLIAKAWRGKGLGAAMCRAAARHIRDRGATGCFIDWTSHALAPFYGKVGAAVWKAFGIYSKPL